MTRRLINLIAGIVRDPDAEAHFHQGPKSTPAVCHVARCPNPRLDVGSG